MGLEDVRLRQDGYVVVDLLTPAELDRVRRLFSEVHRGEGFGWESDFYSPDSGVKRRVHEGLAEGLSAGIERMFVDHHSVLHNFVINWPGPSGGLVLHQHSSIVDERRFRSVVVWCALTEATEENGTLHLVPRSHRIQVGPHPERATSWSQPHHEQLLSDHLTAVPLHAGQAIVFDNQLIHCSFPNSTPEARVTAAAVVVPDAAEVGFYERQGDVARVHRLDPMFFMDQQAGELQWASPDGLEVLAEVPLRPTTASSADLAMWLPAPTCRHGRS